MPDGLRCGRTFEMATGASETARPSGIGREAARMVFVGCVCVVVARFAHHIVIGRRSGAGDVTRYKIPSTSHRTGTELAGSPVKIADPRHGGETTRHNDSPAPGFVSSAEPHTFPTLDTE
jgi:hypothetical protein